MGMAFRGVRTLGEREGEDNIGGGWGEVGNGGDDVGDGDKWW